jgi:environmental stress-induced protein Ves
MQILRAASFKATPWKNGGGLTHEMLRIPPGAAAFRSRLSVAHIDASGPFSDFAGYRRYMVLLRGNGLRLRFAGASDLILREVGDWVEFDGALAADCELFDGPCVDLNFMVLNSMPSAHVQVSRLSLPLALRPAPGETLGVFCMDGCAAITEQTLVDQTGADQAGADRSGMSQMLRAGDLALTSEDAICEAPNDGAAPLVCSLRVDSSP